MHTSVKSICSVNGNLELVDVFGHTSKGLAGLEISGVGTFGKNVKEKIIYLTKKNGIRVGLKRFNIGVDLQNDLKKYRQRDLKKLELAILLVFLFLAEKLDIYDLSRCYVAGEFNIDGKYSVDKLSKEEIQILASLSEFDEYKWVTDWGQFHDTTGMKSIDLGGLCGKISPFFLQSCAAQKNVPNISLIEVCST